MSYVELCKRQEYEQHYPERVHESLLAIGGVYTARIRFNEPSAAEVGARFPLRIIKLGASSESGQLSLGYIALDRDLNDTRVRGITFIADGVFRYGKAIRPSFTLRASNGGQTGVVTAQEGYLSDKPDDIDNEYYLLTSTSGIPITESYSLASSQI